MCINKNTAIKIFFTDIKQLKMILTLSIWSGTIYPFYFCYCCQCFFDLFCVIALGVEPPTKFSKKSGGGGFTGSQFLEGGCWERGGSLLSGGCSFYIKNKIKSEIFNDGKSLSTKMFFFHN